MRALLACLIVALASCAHWSQDTAPESSKSLLAPPKMSPDSVVVETVVVRFPQERSQVLDTIWSTVDEALFSMELRRHLADNGLRAGVLLGDLPTEVRNRLEELSDSSRTSTLEQAGLAADIESHANRFQCRAGVRKEIHVRQEQHEPLVVISNREGHLEGASYEQATMLWDMRTIPHGDGKATLKLLPEIQHGDARKTFVSNGAGLRPEMRRDQQKWPQLELVAQLRPGQILVISSNGQPTAPNLGKAFFTTRTVEQTEERVLLLVKLSATQLDDLFAPEQVEAAQAVAERR